ncbi:MAG: hypothetical protein ACK4Y9_05725 [Hyphomonas sp.]
MDTAPQPTDEDLAGDATVALLERARLFILDRLIFIEGVLGRLGGLPLSASLARHITRHALIPAEIALRRAILILAADLPVPVLRAVPPRAAPNADPRAAKPRPSPPAPSNDTPLRFRMSEPPPRGQTEVAAPPEADYLREDQLPRIRILTDDILRAPPVPPAPPMPAPALRDPSGAFCRRFAALQAAFHNARGEAERWARRRIREMARPGAVQRALPAPLTLPRLGKAVKGAARDLIADLTNLTNTSFCHNTS